MQIDFHHTVTYVVARLAGFSHIKANIIGTCAQYVDDATNSGLMRFDNKAAYNRISSAHKMLDYRNFKELANHQVWIPFHFLPGNSGLPAGENPAGSFINKIVCQPNSFVAQDMVRSCIEGRESGYSLHRLGIAMHVYADTWAHQGFAGINSKVNDVGSIYVNGKKDMEITNRLASFFVGSALPLGHGTVLSYPDKPYLKWSYKNCLGKRITRDNSKDFLEAADHMCRAMQRYRLGDPDAAVLGLPEKDKKKIDTMLRNTKNKDGDKRHEKWIKKIKEGYFSFGPETIKYTPKGVGSWKHRATGTKEFTDDSHEVFKYKTSFPKSDWKMFHDALQAHRFTVLHDILPRYGIIAA